MKRGHEWPISGVTLVLILAALLLLCSGEGVI